MGELIVHGGRPIRGEISIQGSKNSALPILAAAMLADEPCTIYNCPDLSDIRAAVEILKSLGAEASFDGEKAIVCGRYADGRVVSEELMRRMRSSVLFLGPILSRSGVASISYPGGCDLGVRPIDIHLRSMERLGVKFEEENGYIHGRMNEFKPVTVTLMFPSVGATENLMLLCAKSKGKTVLLNPAREPEIVDLQNFLNAMGAKIHGAGTDIIHIEGVPQLYGCTYSVIPDRIAAATYACGAIACGGKIRMTNTDPSHLRMLLSVLEDVGAEISYDKNSVSVAMDGRPMSIPIVRTLPYPGFPTDMQPLLMAALLKSNGVSVFNETIFENRFRHVGELLRMGAEIQVEDRNAVVHGVKNLHGAEVQATDLRGGAALVIAALGADGCTGISNTKYIERGYEDIAGKLQDLNAEVYCR